MAALAGSLDAVAYFYHLSRLHPLSRETVLARAPRLSPPAGSNRWLRGAPCAAASAASAQLLARAESRTVIGPPVLSAAHAGSVAACAARPSPGANISPRGGPGRQTPTRADNHRGRRSQSASPQLAETRHRGADLADSRIDVDGKRMPAMGAEVLEDDQDLKRERV
jgi:hypothetical protein